MTFCQTLAAAMAARLGTTPMAAFQICLQVWLTSSLLNDGLAVAGQVIMLSHVFICIVIWLIKFYMENDHSIRCRRSWLVRLLRRTITK